VTRHPWFVQELLGDWRIFWDCYLNASCVAARWLSSTMNLDDKRFLRELGDRLRERRQAFGLTQDELAKRCRLHRTFVGSVERGERNVSILNLRTIAKALRLVVADLTKDLA
jgi:DNA-binding XRE family transcriptional regulator